MPVIIGIIVIVMLWFGYSFMSSSDESVKTEKQMIIQETESSNKKLSNR